MNSIVISNFVSKIYDLIQPVYQKLDMAYPIANLALRLWVAVIFFRAGMTKIGTWDSTLFLFEYEYSVPLLPPDIAAMIAVAVELSVPIFLALGLAGRLAAFVLFMFNIMAVVSYPELNAIGIKDHQVWGLMLLVPLLQGPGKLSVDYFISKCLKKDC